MPAARLRSLVLLAGCLGLFGIGAQAAIAAPRNLTASSAHVATSPSVSVAGSHRWVAWTEYLRSTSGESTRIRAQRFVGNASKEGPITVATGRLISPVVLTQSDGAAWFFWIEVGSSGGRLKARQRRGGAWVQGAALAVASTRAAYPAADLDHSGNPQLAWESHEGDESRIRTARWTGSAFSSSTTLSQAGVPAYAPALETDADGEIWVVWQAFAKDNYEIFARRSSGSAWGPIWQITQPVTGGKFRGMHALPSIHKGAAGIVWIGWVAKGQDVRAPGTPPQLSSWVRDRRIQLRRVHPNGTLDVVHQVPVPLASLARSDLPPERRGPDRPVLLAARSKVMVFYRALSKRDGELKPIHWRVWMQHLHVGNNRWSVQPLDVGPGTRTEGFPEPAAVASTDTGFWAAWQQGTRKYKYAQANFPEPTSDVFANEIADTQLSAATAHSESPHAYATPLLSNRSRHDPAIRHLGKSYRLYRGDLHSHTHHSTDASAQDDTIAEDHRRMRDLLRLDFLVVTDHGERLSRYQWYLNRSLCLLNNGMRGITTLAGLEYTPPVKTTSAGHQSHGHQNVIYRGCEGGLRSSFAQDTPEKLWGSLPVGQALTIPHHTAEWQGKMTFDFRRFDARFVRLYESYQARGSFECDTCIGVFRTKPSYGKYWAGPADPAKGIAHLQDALAMGRRMGVIASPDHTGFWGVAGVYASTRSQGDLFDALYARRTFGVSNAAARMTLDWRGDGRLMGQEYALRGGDCPVLYGNVRTDYVHPISKRAGVIEQIKVYRVREGGTAPGETGQIFSLKPSAGQRSFVFHDKNCPKTGSASYYMRAVQSDVYGVDTLRRPSIAWSSPVFVTWAAGGPSRKAAVDAPSLPAQVPPNSSHTVKVTVHNTGDIPWTGLEQYGLVADSDGPQIASQVPLDPDEFVLPGGSHTFSVTVNAKVADGTYHLGWQMSSPAGPFGATAKVTMEVLTGADAGPSNDAGPSDAGSADGGVWDAAHASSDSRSSEPSARTDGHAYDDRSSTDEPSLRGGCSLGPSEIAMWPLALLMGLLWTRRRQSSTSV